MEQSWSDVDALLERHLLPADAALESALEASAAAGLPAIAVSPLQGRMLHLMARLMGARRVLEVGTLGGYSTICLASALPPDGELVSIELDPHHADVARSNLANAGLAATVQVVVGRAADVLSTLTGPFDLAFLDADKAGNADYVRLCLPLMRPGAAIVVDNVVRQGAVLDEGSDDASVQGVHRLLALLREETRLDSTAVQTVGSKGWDGFVLARVVG